MDLTLDCLEKHRGQKGLIFINLVDFDMVYGANIKKDVNLGIRATLADCGQTIVDLLGAGTLNHGKSFKKDIVNECRAP